MNFGARLDQLSSEELAPDEKLRMALALYDEGVAMQRMNFRRRFPAASKSELDALLDSWLARETPDVAC